MKNNMNYEILEPVLNQDNLLYWLIRKFEKKSTTPIDKPIKEIIEENKPIEKSIIYDLKEQGLWRCNKCGCEIQSNPSIPTMCYEEQGGCGRNTNFTPITKTINPDLWKLPIWKDIPKENLDMKKVYNDMLNLIKKLLVFSDEIEYKIYVLWIISTWKNGSWDTVGFPVFIGIPNSGKTRALRIIAELGYRAVKSSATTPAVVPRLCHYYNATLTIDEAHNRLDPRKDTELLNFVKDSYKKGAVYPVCDNNNQENIFTYRNFGFKAFAGEKTFNPALLTRSFVFWMDKADPEIAKLSYVSKELNESKTKLLNYRYKTDNPQELGNDFILKGRTREIFESIIATGKHIKVNVEDVIKYAKDRDAKEEAELRDTVQFEILSIIKNHIEKPYLDDAPDKIKQDNIITDLGWEVDNKTRQKMGYILKNMGLTTKRIKEGRFFFIQDNEKRFFQLLKRYKLYDPQKKL